MNGERPVRVYSWRQPVPKRPPRPCVMVQRLAKEITELVIRPCELARLTKLQPAHIRRLLAGEVRPAAATLDRLDAAVEAVKVARGLAQVCDKCEQLIDGDNAPASCSGCNAEGCAACCLPLCGCCSVPLSEAF